MDWFLVIRCTNIPGFYGFFFLPIKDHVILKKGGDQTSQKKYQSPFSKNLLL